MRWDHSAITEMVREVLTHTPGSKPGARPRRPIPRAVLNTAPSPWPLPGWLGPYSRGNSSPGLEPSPELSSFPFLPITHVGTLYPTH